MIDPFWLALAAKMATVAAIVVTASIIVERSGPLVGALVATLPISAGPVYVFIAMEHGAAFVSRSALNSLAANVGTCCFVALYVLLAQRLRLVPALAMGLGLWICGAVAITRLSPTFPVLVAANLIVIPALAFAIRRFRDVRPPVALDRRWWDIPLRAASVMCVAGAAVLIARVFGPEAAGIAALIPVVMISLAVILHPRIGGPATGAVFASSLDGLAGFGMSLMALHVAAVPLGAPAALALMLAVSVGWNLMMLAVHRRLASRRSLG